VSERRAKSRLSARRKTEIVLRVLRGEDVDALSRELRIEAHRIARWREEFLAAGAAALKARAEARAPDRTALKDARAKVGELTMQVEILQELFQKRGLPLPASGEDIATLLVSRSGERRPLALVCRTIGLARSSAYAARRPSAPGTTTRPGPRTATSDDELLRRIREVLEGAAFSGEGHRKVWARLRRRCGLRVSRKRVLRLMRTHGLLAPTRRRWTHTTVPIGGRSCPPRRTSFGGPTRRAWRRPQRAGPGCSSRSTTTPWSPGHRSARAGTASPRSSR